VQESINTAYVKGSSIRRIVSRPEYSFSADWSRGGPIIEQKKIMISWDVDHWMPVRTPPLAT
jgi:hypothetical protein